MPNEKRGGRERDMLGKNSAQIKGAYGKTDFLSPRGQLLRQQT
jgi:hypothetical protein